MLNELDHNSLRYAGPDGEQVTVTVEAQGTTHMVEYTLDGATHALPAGQNISFPIKKKAGDAPTNLQLVMDFAPNGTYTVTVLQVQDCVKDTSHKQTCVHKWSGPNMQIKDFKFFGN